MIDTTMTKGAMETQGFYQSGSGSEEILILGSCRTIAFLNYFVRWNDTIGKNRFTIRRIDPCEWMEVGIEPRVKAAETDPRTLLAIENCDIFIHEHLINYGCFNTDKEAEKNIYQFGLATNTDIGIPNWNDHLILKNDWVAYGAVTPPDWLEKGEWEVQKFCSLCTLTSLPEFGQYFYDTWRKVRYFWRPNHTSAAFTGTVFRMLNDKFLNLETDGGFWNAVEQEDLFRDPHTEVTQEDRVGYRLEW